MVIIICCLNISHVHNIQMKIGTERDDINTLITVTNCNKLRVHFPIYNPSPGQYARCHVICQDPYHCYIS